MKYNIYKEEVKRTLPNLDKEGEKLLNILHMIIGMNSEYNELLDAHNVWNKINIGEELTDINWYMTNYANIRGIPIWNNNSLFKNEMYFLNNGEAIDYIDKLQSEISKLTNLEKRSFVYKKEIEKRNFEEQLIQVAKRLNDCYIYFGLSAEECMEKNINKLKVRYPEKFSEELANNRDLEKEYNTLK